MFLSPPGDILVYLASTSDFTAHETHPAVPEVLVPYVTLLFIRSPQCISMCLQRCTSLASTYQKLRKSKTDRQRRRRTLKGHHHSSYNAER